MMMSFPYVHHVVLDEVQNYRSEDGDWLEKARALVRQHCQNPEHDSGLVSDYDSKLDCSSSDSDSELEERDPTSCSPPTAESSIQLKNDEDEGCTRDTTSESDSGSEIDAFECISKPSDIDRDHSSPGSLWIFIDKDQVNHDYPTGIPEEIYQEPSSYLTKVIRNSKRKISNWAKSYLSDRSAREIEMGHNFDGEKPVFKSYSRGEEMAALKEVLLSLFKEGYSERDIAVLYSKEDCIPERHDLCSQLQLPEIEDAEGNDSECVVFSTFRKYSGLERPVVILVNIAASLPYRSSRKASIYCAITRAIVKVVSLEERKGRKRKHQCN